MQDEYTYKRLLQTLAAANAKVPILSVGFCRADTIEAYYSNDKKGGVVRRRKAVNTNRTLIAKFIEQAKGTEMAAYMLMKEGRKLVSKAEAIYLADNHLHGLDVLSLHGFEATRYSPEMTFKVKQVEGVSSIEVKHFDGTTGQELKDPRLIHKLMLVGKQLITSIEKLSSLRVCESAWEAVIDEENKVKIVNVEVIRLTGAAFPVRIGSCDDLAVQTEPCKELDFDRRKVMKTKMTDIGHRHFLEVLYKKFERAELAKDTEARLGAIRLKYCEDTPATTQASVTDRLQRVLSADFTSGTKSAPLMARTSSRAEIIQQVHKLLQPKISLSPKKPTRNMKPISYQRRKHLMPTKKKITASEVENSTAWAVNKFRKERLRNMELPHYSIKHSLSPSSPSNRLVTLLLTEEESRLKRKAKHSPALSAASTPGSLSFGKALRLISVRTEPFKRTGWGLPSDESSSP